mmetsp:Transcript_12552/g.24979  ORF Transcript_12552/g.24979 Transcript_12552/m.24979 type:complete len:251 (-) Transcript_12552:237-989(-)
MTWNTISQMGMSTPSFAASEWMLFAVATPSATGPFEESTLSGDSPSARRLPTEKLRERSEEQVSKRSPAPARPGMARALEPIALASLDISDSPRQMRAALVLFPKPKPVEQPEATARTFFTAPAISHPITSSDEYVLKLDLKQLICPCTFLVSSSLKEATTTFVGCPCATSLAKDGPESTATSFINSSGSTSLTISYGVIMVDTSMPFAHRTNGTPLGRISAFALRKPLKNCEGIATSMISTPSTEGATS